MKIQVLRVFRDKFDQETMYQPGSVHEFDDGRAVDLIERGLGAPFEDVGEIGITGELGEPGVPGESNESNETKKPTKAKPDKDKK